METLNYEARRCRSKAERNKVCRCGVGWFVPLVRGVGSGGQITCERSYTCLEYWTGSFLDATSVL